MNERDRMRLACMADKVVDQAGHTAQWIRCCDPKPGVEIRTIVTLANRLKKEYDRITRKKRI